MMPGAQIKPFDDTLAAFGRFILEQQSDITRQWVAAIDRSKEVETEDLTFHQLLDHFPQLCAELAETLRDPGAGEPRNEAETHGLAHGRKRWQQGFRLEELMRELALVRRDFLGRWLDAFEERKGELPPDTRRRAKRTVHRFFDELLIASTLQFVEEQQQGFVAREQEMRILKQRAEAADAAKDRFIALISHELRTPLTPVLLNAAALAAEPNLSQHARELLAVITCNAFAEAALIDNLLDASRLNLRAFCLTNEEVDVSDSLAAALEITAREFASKEITPEMNLTAAPARRQADRERLKRAFTAILRNAANVTRPHGRVAISSRIEAGQIEICIEDSGPEFSDEIASVIFDPFEAGRSSLFGVGNIGLGRYVAKSIIEAHGGTISVRPLSKAGGAMFVIRLPLPAFR